MEIGTLKELNVKPGDTVERMPWPDGSKFNVGKLYQISADLRAIGDGCWDQYHSDGIFRIVSPVDLAAITTPFGLLDAATQEALRAHGGPYEWFPSQRWERIHELPSHTSGFAYRVKPAPKRETVRQDGWMTEGGSFRTTPNVASIPVRVTFDRVDGQIDLPTYRVEAR